jgi:hypothetical protein
MIEAWSLSPDADRSNQGYLGTSFGRILIAFKEDVPAPSRRRMKKLLT